MQKKLEEQFRTPYGNKQLNEVTEKILKEQNLSKRADEISRQTIFKWSGSVSDSISVRDSIKRSLTVLHAGLLSIDPVTGAIRAWAGGIDFNSQPYDQIVARRQLGSVFKPVLYALAFEEGMEPCQYLDNDSIILSGYENWSPENFDHSNGGKYSLAGALSRSMNIPTFSLFLKLGFAKLDSLWTGMGFSFTLNNTPALALGTAEASIEEIAVAYSAFANGGFKINPWSIVSIIAPDGEIIYQNNSPGESLRILTERSCRLISAILQKATMEGTGASLRSAYSVNSPVAGKTGTSQNYADAWFAAFTPKLTIVARAGASSPSIHFNSQSYGTGSALALPLVALTLKKAESDPETSNQFFAPFPVLSPELVSSLDCPDFRKDNFLNKLLDIFKKKEIVFEEEIDKADRKKKSLLERIFGR
jgi:penicillin-binding protein 1A